MVAMLVNSMERNGWTLRVAMPPVCHPEAFYSDDFTFSYFDTELQES